jgi:predicted O-methyltransferase YrrM
MQTTLVSNRSHRSKLRRLLGPVFVPARVALGPILRRAPTRYSQLLRGIAELTPCSTIVEIGTWNGNRAIELASMALWSNKAVRYYGFDLFEMLTDGILEKEISKRPPSKAHVEQELAAFAHEVESSFRWLLRNRSFEYELRQGFTTDTLPVFRADHPEFDADFVFIDGGHALETIENDWRFCSQMIRRGGVVYFDDFYDNDEMAKKGGCRQLIERLASQRQWKASVLPIKDFVAGIGNIQIARVQVAGPDT